MSRHALLATLLALHADGSDAASLFLKSRKAPNTVASYRRGDLVEALDTKTGQWIPTKVVGAGRKPQTFNLAVPDIGVVPDISSVALRRATKMHQGDLVEVHEIKTDQWLPGTVAGDGEEVSSYDVEVPGAGVVKDVPDVAVRRAMRFKTGDITELLDLKSGLWLPSVILGDGAKVGTYDVGAYEAGNFQDMSPSYLRKAYIPSPGDLVEVFDNETKDWLQGTAVSMGSKPNTYTLVMQDVGFIYNVPKAGIRKAAQHGDTTMGMTLHKDMVVEFMDKTTGSWVPATVIENGTKRDTYTVEAPVIGRMFDLSTAAMRKPDTFKEMDIAEALDAKTGIWVQGTIVGQGRMPGTFDITLPRAGFYGDLPTTKLRHAQRPVKGEMMEVLDVKNKEWITCKVIEEGTKEDTFSISIPQVGQMTDVPMELLRRVARPRF